MPTTTDVNFLGDEIYVNTNTGGSPDQFAPRSAPLPDGGWVVVWYDHDGWADAPAARSSRSASTRPARRSAARSSSTPAVPATRAGMQ